DDHVGVPDSVDVGRRDVHAAGERGGERVVLVEQHSGATVENADRGRSAGTSANDKVGLAVAVDVRHRYAHAAGERDKRSHVDRRRCSNIADVVQTRIGAKTVADANGEYRARSRVCARGGEKGSEQKWKGTTHSSNQFGTDKAMTLEPSDRCRIVPAKSCDTERVLHR